MFVAYTPYTNQNVNKVVVNNEVILDISADTVTPDKLLSGTTAHNNKGVAITGSMVNQGELVETISTFDGEIIKEAGYYSGIDVHTDPGEDFEEGNIRAGKTILGLTGTMEPGVDVSDTTAAPGTVCKERPFMILPEQNKLVLLSCKQG